MPVVSKAQNAAMHAAASGHSTLGIPKKVGQEFTADQAPGSIKKLPQHVKAKSVAHKANHLARRGTISNKQHDKLTAKYKPASAGDTDDIKSKTSME